MPKKTATKSASKSATKSATKSANGASGEPKQTAPKGYSEQGTSDLVGFWVPDEAGIHVRPIGFTLSDSKIEKEKVAVLIMGELIDPCELVCRSEDGEAETVMGDKGDVVGIWGKPGMRAILRLGGEPTFIRASGEKDVGKPKPMKLFEVLARGKGERLPLIDDHRRDSIDASCWALPKRRPGASRRRAAPTGDEPDYDADDVPF